MNLFAFPSSRVDKVILGKAPRRLKSKVCRAMFVNLQLIYKLDFIASNLV